MKTSHSNFLKLAFNIAKINIGKTKSNPSVGCVIVKNKSIIASGLTSISGRPHAEHNALISNKNFKNSDLYVTMEPCTHYGLTPPCTNLIAKKGIKRVFYSFADIDKRTSNKSKKILIKKKITTKKIPVKEFKDFYKSYFILHEQKIPFIDAKIAISKDYSTISKKSKWITNQFSRKCAHLLRSEYDLIVSTSKTINKDNALLNCRINGFDDNKPDLAIIDMNLKIKKRLELFKKFKKRKIFIITAKSRIKKNFYSQKKNIKFILIKSLKDEQDFKNLFNILKKKNYNRILIETGLVFLNEVLKMKLVHNLYMFKSNSKLFSKGKNNTTNTIIKRYKLNNRIKVNLANDKLYKIKIK